MTTADHDNRELVAALLDSFEGSGLRTVRLPEPERRREPTVRLLNRIMADPEQLDDYVRLVESMREERGFRVVMPLLGRDAPDITEDAILLSGFSAASDELLADVAICPEGLKAIQAVIYAEGSHNRLGEWFAEAAVSDPGDVASDPPPSPAEPKPSAATKAGGQKWLWVLVVGLGGLTCLVGVVGFGTYRVGERVHQSLDRFEADTAQGKYTAAVAHLRAAQTTSADSTWPLPESAKSRLALLAGSPLFLERLLPSQDLEESESALRSLLTPPRLGDEPANELALGMTLRRRGKLTEAAAEFEKVIARFGSRSDVGPGTPPREILHTSEGQEIAQMSAVIGSTLSSDSEQRLALAVTSLEAGDFRRARELLLRQADRNRDRPFGSRFFRKLSERLLELDALVPRPPGVAATPPTNPADLRDYALLHLYRGHYTTAAELFHKALTHPDYAAAKRPDGMAVDGIRYFAAAAAVQSGRFEDKDSPSDDAARLWHEQALVWAAADREIWLGEFGRADDGIDRVYEWFTHVRYDHFLAVTRDRPMVARLPTEERAKWKEYWADLDRRFGGLTPATAKEPNRRE